MDKGFVMNAKNLGFDLVYAEDPNTPKGWVCPRCGASLSPSVQVCPNCKTQKSNEGLAPGEQMICDAM